MHESLKNLSTIEYGASPKEIRSNDYTSIGIYGTGGLVGSATKSLFHGPLVVVARKGTLDKPLYINGDCWVIDTAYAVLPNANVDAKWLYYNLLKFDLKKLNESTGVPSISRDYLYRVTFETFALPEQRKIASILSTVDAVIEKTEAAIAKYKAIKSGMMRDLFTRGIDLKTGKLRPRYEDAPELYKQSWLGWVPKEWEVVSVEQFASKDKNAIVDGPFGSNLKTIHYKTEGVPIIQSGFVTSNRFHAEEYLYVTKEKFISEIRSKVSPGDIVMAKIGAQCGTSAILPSNHPISILAGNCLKITVSRTNSNVFFEHYLHYLYDTKMIFLIISTTAQPAVSMSSLKLMSVIQPSSDEQILIAKRINIVALSEITEASVLTKYQQLKAALMSDLLTGKARVKVSEP